MKAESYDFIDGALVHGPGYLFNMIIKSRCLFVRMNMNRRKSSRYIRIVSWTWVLLLVIYLLIPVIFYSSLYLQRHFIFKHDVAVPNTLNFSNPEKEGLFGAFNRYITTATKTNVGVWQILPQSLITSVPSSLPNGNLDLWFRNQLDDHRPVIIYCHGNTPSRATPHRIAMYKILQKLEFHVITFDYRGFADSTKVDPTEMGLIEDALEIVKWLKKFSTSDIFIWGHSLGTGVATATSAHLCRFETCPSGLILQAPFTSIAEELRNIYVTLPFRILPWFDAMFIDPLKEQEIIFNNEQHIGAVKCPILFIHSEDDSVVPFSLGKQLYNFAKVNRSSKSGLIKFIALSGNFNYGHNDVYKAPQLPIIIRSFLTEASKYES